MMKAKHPEIPDITLAAKYPLRILIVEDDKINLHLLLMLLRQCGYNPLVASNGQEGMEIYKKNPVDCIFLDVRMPIMDGIEATLLIRDIEYVSGNAHCAYILGMSADSCGIYKKDCLEAGMNGYLSKPISGACLAQKLMEAHQFTTHDDSSTKIENF